MNPQKINKMKMEFTLKKDELFKFAISFEKQLIDYAFETSIILIRLASKPESSALVIRRLTYFDELRKQCSSFYNTWRNEIIEKTDSLIISEDNEDFLLSELKLIEQDLHTAASVLKSELNKLRSKS